MRYILVCIGLLYLGCGKNDEEPKKKKTKILHVEEVEETSKKVVEEKEKEKEKVDQTTKPDSKTSHEIVSEPEPPSPTPTPQPEVITEPQEEVMDECGFYPSTQQSVVICGFKTEPDNQEEILLKNYGEETIDLSGHSLKDENLYIKEKQGWSFPEGTMIESQKTYKVTDFTFRINNRKENLYLYTKDGELIHLCEGASKGEGEVLSHCFRS